jgi:hypothetical protein
MPSAILKMNMVIAIARALAKFRECGDESVELFDVRETHVNTNAAPRTIEFRIRTNYW